MRDVFTARNARLADAIPVTEELGARQRGASTGAALIGSPDTVGKRIEQLSEWGINHLMLRFMGEWAGQTKGIAESSMRLFNEEVMPRFKNVATPNGAAAVPASGGLGAAGSAAAHPTPRDPPPDPSPTRGRGTS